MHIELKEKTKPTTECPTECPTEFDNDCAICYQPLTEPPMSSTCWFKPKTKRPPTRLFDCSHTSLFHTRCLLNWIQRKLEFQIECVKQEPNIETKRRFVSNLHQHVTLLHACPMCRARVTQPTIRYIYKTFFKRQVKDIQRQIRDYEHRHQQNRHQGWCSRWWTALTQHVCCLPSKMVPDMPR